MPEDAQITLTPPVLPEDFCPANEQERANGYFALAGAILPGTYSTFVTGSSTPVVDDQDKIWVRTNADGSFDRLYTFYSGAWVSPHPIPPSTNGWRGLWEDSLANLALFEGGDAGAITELTGSFYEAVAAWDNKIPIGAGATAAVGVNATVLDVGTPAQDVRGVYIIRRSARRFYVA